jgi:predicted nucleotidyltransferase
MNRKRSDFMNLRVFAEDISKIYMKNSKVEAILLGGSVGRNWNDEYSDIELFVLWKEGPTDEDRMATIRNLDGSVIDFYPYEDEEWSETYITNGVKLEISNFLTSTIECVINDVTLSIDSDLDKQCLVATVDDGVSLDGEEVIRALKEKVAVYPEALGQAMILENVDLGSRWNNREALLARQDWLMLYKVMVAVQTNIMGILFGLNRVYVHHPAFKWQRHALEAMHIVPKNLAERLESVLISHPTNSVMELENIIQEVYELVEKEMPTIDLTKFWNRANFVRPKHD